MLSLRRLAVGVLIVSCVAVRTADASPILYLYTGTANADPDLQALIPPGSPATILLTVDPAVNILAGFPGYPPNAGLYSFSAVLDFTGREYTLSNGYFEVNYDPQNGVPNGGITNLVELPTVEGPNLIANPPPGPGPGYPLTGCGGGMCRYSFFSADSSSPALPFFPDMEVPIAFSWPGPDPHNPFERVNILGSDPQVVPEPSTLLLVGTGLVAVARRRLKRAGGIAVRA